MKSIILVALALVALAVAAPTETEVPQVIHSQFDQQPEGNYVAGFETDNGIKQEMTGELKEVLDEEQKPHLVIVVRGKYEYTDGQGNIENVNYYADETGYHAEGPSIPKNERR